MCYSLHHLEDRQICIPFPIKVSRFGVPEDDREADDIDSVGDKSWKLRKMGVLDSLGRILAIPVSLCCARVYLGVLDTPARLLDDGQKNVQR